MKKNQQPQSIPWQEAETLPRYTVGKLSALFDMHPQSIRYFDTVNLVRPVRDESNGRRIYSNRDMFDIVERMKYKNIGLSIKETERLLEESRLGALDGWMQLCEQRMRKEQERLVMMQAGVARLQEKIRQIPLLLERCTYQRRPAMYAHLHHINGQYDESPDAVAARKQFIDWMPLSFYLFEIPAAGLPTEDYRWHIAMEEAAAKAVGFDRLAGIRRIEAEDCIHTVFSLTGDDAINAHCYAGAMSFISSNGWQTHGNVYGSFIASIRQNGTAERYFDAWIPIRSLQQV